MTQRQDPYVHCVRKGDMVVIGPVRTDGRLLALFERIIQGEGGVYAADTAAGLSRGTMSRWTTRTDIRPGAENLRRLARKLGAKYGCTEPQLLVWAGYGGDVAEPPDPEYDARLRRPRPVWRVEQRIPAEGTWPLVDETPAETTHDHLWEMDVHGQCMEPAIMHRDTVWIDPTTTPVAGDIVAVYLDGDWTLKRLRRANGTLLLVPDNPAFAPVELPRNELRVLGVVVAVIHHMTRP